MSPKTLKLFGLSVFLVGALALSPGCKVGPDYQRPAALGTNTMPAAFTGAGETNHGEWKVAEPSAHLPRGEWWQVFTDAELDRLQGLANANNQELAAAVARVTEARAEVKIARADLFPQIAVAPNYTRQRTSFNEPQNGHAAHSAPIYNTFTLPVAAGWEADLWGRIRREVESARAQLTA